MLLKCLWAGMLSCICRDASLQVEMLIVKEKMLFIEISTSVWPSRYGGRTSLGRADASGRSFKSPSAKFCCGCGPGGGGYLGRDGGFRWIWSGQGEFGVCDMYFRVFFHCFCGYCCRGLVSEGGTGRWFS